MHFIFATDALTDAKAFLNGSYRLVSGGSKGSTA